MKKDSDNSSSNGNSMNDNNDNRGNRDGGSALTHLVTAAGMRSSLQPVTATSVPTGSREEPTGDNCGRTPSTSSESQTLQGNDNQNAHAIDCIRQSQPQQQPLQRQQQYAPTNRDGTSQNAAPASAQPTQHRRPQPHLQSRHQQQPQHLNHQSLLLNDIMCNSNFNLASLRQQMAGPAPADTAQDVSAKQIQTIQNLLSSQSQQQAAPLAPPKPAPVSSLPAGLQTNDLLTLARSIPLLSSLTGMGIGDSPLEIIQRLGLQNLLQAQQQSQPKQQPQQPQQKSQHQKVNQAPIALQQHQNHHQAVADSSQHHVIVAQRNARPASPPAQNNSRHEYPPHQDTTNSVQFTTSNSNGGQQSSSGDSLSNNNNNNNNNVPGTTILPCRARGMPVDHNFRAAHFVIRGNVEHGEDLICSYSACRNAGVKFRYCSFCRVPVAKRNFHQRHGHGIPTNREEAQATKSSGTLKRAPAHNAQPTGSGNNKNNNNKKNTTDDNIKYNKMSSTNKTAPLTKKNLRHQALAGNEDRGRYNLNANQKVSSSDPSGTSTSTSKSTSTEVPHVRQVQWAALLRRRPDTSDSDNMSAWLLEVMAVSDLNAPLNHNNDSSSTQGRSPLTTSNSSSELSSDTNEPTSSLNSSTYSDLSSDVSSLDQDPRRSLAKKNRGQKRERRITADNGTSSRRNALPTAAAARGGENDGGDEQQERGGRRKKKHRTSAYESEAAVAPPNPSKHRKSQQSKNKVSSSSKAYGGGGAHAPSGGGGGGGTKRRVSETKDKNNEAKPERKSEQLGGNYSEWRERKKQKTLSKKKKVAHAGSNNKSSSAECTV